MPRRINELLGHKALKVELKEIMQNFGFKAYREVHFNFSDKRNKNRKYIDEGSVDLIVKISENGKNSILFFECKDTAEFKNPVTEKQRAEDIADKLKQGTVNIISAEDKGLKKTDFNNLNKVIFCFAFTKKTKLESHYDFNIWGYPIVKYFNKISKITRTWGRYEIYREFGLNFEAKDSHTEDAIKIRQNNREMYLIGLNPGLLLKIGYVMRRTSNVSEAYQRLLNKDRVEKVSEFLKSRNVLLPNAIILSFDSDIDRQINYDDSTHKLTFPVKYCSAWIIDGQHRTFGFINTKYKNWTSQNNDVFKLPVVAFKALDKSIQSKTFVNINYYQKRIDPTLLCDLATVIEDMKNELTWPSLLVSKINQETRSPLYNKIKITELDEGRQISLASFVQYGLLETLLGYNKKTNQYSGALYKYAPFNIRKNFTNRENKIAFQKQLDLLKRYFSAIKSNTKGAIWENVKKYGLLKPTGINALLLVLAKIIEADPAVSIDLNEYLKPIKRINFGRKHISKQGGGWKGFRNFANEIIKEINRTNTTLKLGEFGKNDKI